MLYHFMFGKARAAKLQASSLNQALLFFLSLCLVWHILRFLLVDSLQQSNTGRLRRGSKLPL